MQKILIRNNGPINDFEMEVNKFNILIGEQATGKSTVAKSIYFFHTIKTTILIFCGRSAIKIRIKISLVKIKGLTKFSKRI